MPGGTKTRRLRQGTQLTSLTLSVIHLALSLASKGSIHKVLPVVGHRMVLQPPPLDPVPTKKTQ